MREHSIGDIWTDRIDGLQVVTFADAGKVGCKECAYATSAGGACPGSVYDRHPCSASDRKDGCDVYYKLVAVVPEAKAPPMIFRHFGSVPFKMN